VSYDDRISIPTPEGVELELVLAGLGSRLVATIVDFLIRMAVLFALLLVGGSVGGDEARPHSGQDEFQLDALGGRDRDPVVIGHRSSFP